MKKYDQRIIEKLLEIIPENGEPIRKKELQKRIKEKELKWGGNKHRINKHLDLMCQRNLIKKTILENVRGKPVEYSKNFTEENIKEGIENSSDYAVTQYLKIGFLLSDINTLLLKNIKEYGELEQENTRDDEFEKSMDEEIIPLINKLTLYVKNNDFANNPYRCLLGDFNFSLRYNIYEKHYYDNIYLNEVYNTKSPHHYILLETKYKDKEERLLSKANKMGKK